MDIEHIKEIARKTVSKIEYGSYTDGRYEKPIEEQIREERERVLNCTDHKIDEMKNRAKQIEMIKERHKR